MPDANDHDDRQLPEPTGTLSVAIMKCDDLSEASIPCHGTYEDVLDKLFRPILRESAPHLKLKTRAYDVVEKREYPSEQELETVDCVLITGSFEDDSVADTTWILRLCGFLIQINDCFPRIRILGICFGLQVLVRAFGPSRVEPNPKGWEVGSTKVNLSDIGRKLIWGKASEDESSDLPDHVMMQQIHGDICTELPADFELLGSSQMTPIQGIVHFYAEDKQPPSFVHSYHHTLPPDPWRRVHILAIQGHPEWDHEIIVPFIKDYEENGTMSAKFADGARERARQPHDGQMLGRALLKVLGIA